MEAFHTFGSSVSFPANSSNFDTARFKPPTFSNGPSLSCSSSPSYPGLKLSPTRCSLNQNGGVSGPNPDDSKATRGASMFRLTAMMAASIAAARMAVSIAASLPLEFLLWFGNLVNLPSNTIMNQVLKAFYNLDPVTPFHFTPAHFAVGVGALLFILTIFGVYKWAKNSGTERPVDVQRNHLINGAREGEALPTKTIVNISVNFNLFKDGDGQVGTIFNC